MPKVYIFTTYLVYVCAKVTGWHESLRFMAYPTRSLSTLTISTNFIDRCLLVTYLIKNFFDKVLIIWPAGIWITNNG